MSDETPSPSMTVWKFCVGIILVASGITSVYMSPFFLSADTSLYVQTYTFLALLLSGSWYALVFHAFASLVYGIKQGWNNVHKDTLIFVFATLIGSILLVMLDGNDSLLLTLEWIIGGAWAWGVGIWFFFGRNASSLIMYWFGFAAQIITIGALSTWFWQERLRIMSHPSENQLVRRIALGALAVFLLIGVKGCLYTSF